MNELIKKPDNNVKIWRYLDFSKYIDLILSKSLYFRRLDLLREQDKYEGLFTNCDINNYKKLQNFQKIGTNIIYWYIAKFLSKSSFVNCWHINNYESLAMWKIYGRYPESVCIQTTYDKLRSQLPVDVSIGEINYVDEKNEPHNSSQNIISPLMWKRKPFNFENELRAIIVDFVYDNDFIKIEKEDDTSILLKFTNILSPKDHEYVYINVPRQRVKSSVEEEGRRVNLLGNFDDFIENVYISPEAPGHFHELVKDISKEHFSKEKIRISSIFDNPETW